MAVDFKSWTSFGGSCFPKDTKAIINTAEKHKINLSLIKSVVKSNDSRNSILISKINKILNNKIKKKITFWRSLLKHNTDDMEDSPSLKMIPALIRNGALVNYYDPTGPKKTFQNLEVYPFLIH